MQKGDAAINVMQNHVANFLMFVADDFDFHLVFAQHQHFVQHNGVDQYQDNAVQNIFGRAEQDLEQQDNKVETVHADRNRDFKQFVQYLDV